MKTAIGYIDGIGNYEVTTPEEAIFIYSRHVYCSVRVTGDNAPLSGLKIILSIVDTLNNTLHKEYRYTDAEGRVTFDVARTLQTITNDREKEMSSLMYDYNDNAIWAMRQVKFQLVIEKDTTWHMLTTPYEFITLINGSHDNAYNWNVHDNIDKAMRLKAWRNYPFTIDMGNVDRVYWKTIPNTTSSPSTWLKQFVVKSESEVSYQMIRYNITGLMDRYPTAQRIFVRTDKTNGETLSITDGKVTVYNITYYSVELAEAPSGGRATYLRWLGKHGEVFYWLFDNITEDISVKSDTYARTMTDDTFRGLVTNRMRDNGIIKDSTTTRTRTIATDFLDKDYFELVASIAESPYVDILIGEEENEKWQRVLVADGSFSRSMKVADRAKRNRISLTIEIPEI